MNTCSTCNERRTVECPVCRGIGIVNSKTCYSCRGKKKIPCPKCGEKQNKNSLSQRRNNLKK